MRKIRTNVTEQRCGTKQHVVAKQMTTLMMELNTDCFVRWCLGLIKKKHTLANWAKITQHSLSNCTPSPIRPTQWTSLELGDWTSCFCQWHLAVAHFSMIPPTLFPSLAFCGGLPRFWGAMHDADLPELRKCSIGCSNFHWTPRSHSQCNHHIHVCHIVYR